MASKSRLKAQVEDELRTLFVCPAILQQQIQQCCKGAGEQLLAKVAAGNLSTAEAQQQFERQLQSNDPSVFGPHAPAVSQKDVLKSQLQALAISHNEKTPGFSHVLKLCTANRGHQAGGNAIDAAQHAGSANSPLLRLLRRVALWYYYRVMFDPLDQLVALNSSCELLFQLMTPHQQLACMADILLVLACPALEQHSGQLDTPLHTATLLSMLKMAQDLALAEADVRQQVEERRELRRKQEQREQQQQQDEQADLQALTELRQRRAAAVNILTPPALGLLRVFRQQGIIGPLSNQDMGSNILCYFGGLQDEACRQLSGTWQFLGPASAVSSLHQSNTSKAVGAFLSQLSQLPQKQLNHWKLATADDGRPPSEWELEAQHAEVLGKMLQQCCTGLEGVQPLELTPDVQPGEGGDPLSQLLQWVVAAISGRAPQQQQQGATVAGSDVLGQQQSCHPAEALRQVLDVLLSALQYRHVLSMQQWGLAGHRHVSQKLLLAALHCHCMQLLAQARDTLPLETCTLGQGSASSSSSDGSTRQQQQQQQQQREAWQLCLAQVQHNLLLVLQLTSEWQKVNAHCCLSTALEQNRDNPDFLPHFLAPNSNSNSSSSGDGTSSIQPPSTGPAPAATSTAAAAAAVVGPLAQYATAATAAAGQEGHSSKLHKGFLGQPDRQQQQQAGAVRTSADAGADGLQELSAAAAGPGQGVLGASEDTATKRSNAIKQLEKFVQMLSIMHNSPQPVDAALVSSVTQLLCCSSLGEAGSVLSTAGRLLQFLLKDLLQPEGTPLRLQADLAHKLTQLLDTSTAQSKQRAQEQLRGALTVAGLWDEDLEDVLHVWRDYVNIAQAPRAAGAAAVAAAGQAATSSQQQGGAAGGQQGSARSASAAAAAGAVEAAGPTASGEHGHASQLARGFLGQAGQQQQQQRRRQSARVDSSAAVPAAGSSGAAAAAAEGDEQDGQEAVADGFEGLDVVEEAMELLVQFTLMAARLRQNPGENPDRARQLTTAFLCSNVGEVTTVMMAAHGLLRFYKDAMLHPGGMREVPMTEAHQCISWLDTSTQESRQRSQLQLQLALQTARIKGDRVEGLLRLWRAFLISHSTLAASARARSAAAAAAAAAAGSHAAGVSEVVSEAAQGAGEQEEEEEGAASPPSSPAKSVLRLKGGKGSSGGSSGGGNSATDTDVIDSSGDDAQQQQQQQQERRGRLRQLPEASGLSLSTGALATSAAAPAAESAAAFVMGAAGDGALSRRWHLHARRSPRNSDHHHQQQQQQQAAVAPVPATGAHGGGLPAASRCQHGHQQQQQHTGGCCGHSRSTAAAAAAASGTASSNCLGGSSAAARAVAAARASGVADMLALYQAARAADRSQGAGSSTAAAAGQQVTQQWGVDLSGGLREQKLQHYHLQQQEQQQQQQQEQQQGRRPRLAANGAQQGAESAPLVDSETTLPGASTLLTHPTILAGVFDYNLDSPQHQQQQQLDAFWQTLHIDEEFLSEEVLGGDSTAAAAAAAAGSSKTGSAAVSQQRCATSFLQPNHSAAATAAGAAGDGSSAGGSSSSDVGDPDLSAEVRPSSTAAAAAAFANAALELVGASSLEGGDSGSEQGSRSSNGDARAHIYGSSSGSRSDSGSGKEEGCGDEGAWGTHPGDDPASPSAGAGSVQPGAQSSLPGGLRAAAAAAAAGGGGGGGGNSRVRRGSLHLAAAAAGAAGGGSDSDVDDDSSDSGTETLGSRGSATAAAGAADGSDAVSDGIEEEGEEGVSEQGSEQQREGSGEASEEGTASEGAAGSRDQGGEDENESDCEDQYEDDFEDEYEADTELADLDDDDDDDDESYGGSATSAAFKSEMRSAVHMWEVRQQYGAPLQQQQQQRVRALNAAVVNAFKPSEKLDHFVDMPPEQAAAWIELLTEALREFGGDSLELDRFRSLVHCANELPLEEVLSADFDTVDANVEDLQEAMADVNLLALLTLALCWSPFEVNAFKGEYYRRTASKVVDELLLCIDDAYTEVLDNVKQVPSLLASCDTVYNRTVWACLERLRSAVSAHKLQRKLTSVDMFHKGLAGMPASVAELIRVVNLGLQQLGPVPVEPWERSQLNDKLLQGSLVQLHVSEWVKQFASILEYMRLLVRLDAWLAHTGRNMQKLLKPLRRARRVLLTDHNDRILRCLQQQFVADAFTRLSTALASVVQTHQLLRVAFVGNMGQDGWGVLQRALRLLAEMSGQLQAQDGSQKLKQPHEALTKQMGAVFSELLDYVIRSSPLIPDMQTDMDQLDSLGRLGEVWHDHDWQRLFSTVATLQPPMARWWWLLPLEDAAVSVGVDSRATGDAVVYRASLFASRGPIRSSSSSSSKHKPVKAPAAAAAAGDSSSSDEQQPERLDFRSMYPLNCNQSKHVTSNFVPCAPSSSEDEATVHAAEQAHNSACFHLEYLQEISDRQAAWERDEGHSGNWCAPEFSAQMLPHVRQVKAQRVKCRRLLHMLPHASEWQKECLISLNCETQPEDTTSAGTNSTPPSSSSDSGSDNGSDSDSSSRSDGGREGGNVGGVQRNLEQRLLAAAGFQTPQHRQRRRDERALRQLVKLAPLYGWGGLRPWHVQRAKVLVQRQLQLNRVMELQQQARQGLQQQQQRAPARLAAAAGADSSSSSGGGLQQVVLSVSGSAALPLQSAEFFKPPAATYIQHMKCTVASTCSSTDDTVAEELLLLGDQAGAMQQVVSLWQDCSDLQAAAQGTGVAAERVVAAVTDSLLQMDLGNSTQDLLWQLAMQMKPAACHWYQHGALQQQQGKGKAGSISAAYAAADVPACTSPALWSTLTRSLACDLLLVPPSIRDMVGNNWAAGAGRLQGYGADSSSSSIAARMLVVQYARAARREYVQEFYPQVSLGHLLSLQLLAEDHDMLTELQQGAGQQVATALAAHTAAAAAGMQPQFMVAAQLAGVDVYPGTAAAAVAAAAAAGGDGQASSALPQVSSSSGRDRPASGSLGHPLSLYQVAAQYFLCFPGSVETTLPWLQLLARFHAFADHFAAQSKETWRYSTETEVDGDPRLERGSNALPGAVSGAHHPEDRLAALAVTLLSYGPPYMPTMLQQLQVGVGIAFEECERVPTAAALVTTPATQLIQTLQLRLHSQQQQRIQQQVQQQQQQQPGGVLPGAAWETAEQQEGLSRQPASAPVRDDLSGVFYWLHADRLAQVHPNDWQQHLAAHVSSSGKDVLLVTDQACDWCCGALWQQQQQQQQNPRAAGGVKGGQRSSSSSSSKRWGCPSCGSAQYCSQQCADAAKKVHNDNCWRLQALARDGLCWQQPAFQRPPQSSSSSSNRTRSFWDLSAVEQQV